MKKIRKHLVGIIIGAGITGTAYSFLPVKAAFVLCWIVMGISAILWRISFDVESKST